MRKMFTYKIVVVLKSWQLFLFFLEKFAVSNFLSRMVLLYPQDADGEIQEISFIGGMLHGHRRVKQAAQFPPIPFITHRGGKGQLLGKSDFGKTRLWKPFLGVWRRFAEKRELLIAFFRHLCYIYQRHASMLFEAERNFCPSRGRHYRYSGFSS